MADRAAERIPRGMAASFVYRWSAARSCPALRLVAYAVCFALTRLGGMAPARLGKPYDGFVTRAVAGVSFVSKMADGDLVRSPPIPA